MALIDTFLDRYNLLARQRPALLMLFPLLVAAVVILPALQTWWATLLAVTGTCGVAVALAEFAQAKGKAIEPALLRQWDGLPSVAMLRHRDGRLDGTTKTRYKAFLEKHVSGLDFPDEASERQYPAEAEVSYQSATRWLLAQTRDKKVFALLFQQNISYGFRRNLYGLRYFGMGSSIMAVLLLIAVPAWGLIIHGVIKSEILVAGVIALAVLWFWVSVVRPTWVAIAANGYAHELLAACDRLHSTSHLATPRR
jgi:hypothetical protein